MENELKMVNEKGQVLLQIKKDYDNLEPQIIKDATKEGLKIKLKGDYTPTIITSLFELSYDELLKKVLKAKTLIRSGDEIVKGIYDDFMKIDIEELRSKLKSCCYSYDDYSKVFIKTVGDNKEKNLILNSIKKCQLVKDGDCYYILKKAGIKFTSFNSLVKNLDSKEELFRNRKFMINYIENFHKSYLKEILDFTIELGSVESLDDNLKNDVYKEEDLYGYNFNIMIPVTRELSIVNVFEYLCKLNLQIVNLRAF